MSDPLAPQDDASTPLSEEEREGLIPSYIALRGELNNAEQANILEAAGKALRRKQNILDQRALNRLHKNMFGNVWKWAGKFRTSNKNIGIEAYKVANELQILIDDCKYWIEHETYEPDEIAARFHHKLVYIDPYANGNGRHARLATDLLLISMGRERFTWGSANLVDASETRAQYVAALRAADKHDYALLFEFVRS
jgi:Fic-DOC domain mobile mystery protein B